MRILLVTFCLLSASLSAELVDVRLLDPTMRFDIRYASTNNCVRAQLYSKPVCYLHKEVAAALVRAQRELRCEGLSLKVLDAYRPIFIEEELSQLQSVQCPVATEKDGGRHTRGTSVDVTLVRADGRPLKMHSSSDNMSPAVISNRAKLRDVMSRHGFLQHENEWWHFDFSGWEEYPALSISFEDLQQPLVGTVIKTSKGLIDRVVSRVKEPR